MKRHPILSPLFVGGLTIATAAAVTVTGAAPIASATGRTVAAPHSKTCASTSSTGTAASKYDTTPKGRGPWKVPLDPCNTEGMGSAGTPYYNCAYWAAEKRPDIWVNAVWKYGYGVAPGGAWNIEIDARQAGYSITHKPKVGDVAAWPVNATMGHTGDGTTYTARPGGHVAYVQKVHGKKITISTMGVSSRGGMTESFTFNKKKTYFIHTAH